MRQRLRRYINKANRVFDLWQLFTPVQRQGSGYLNEYIPLSSLFQLSNGTTAVTADGDPVGYVTNLSPGATFNLTQATAGSRTALAHIPAVGVRNQLNATNDLGNVAWNVNTTMTVSSGVADPDGGATAYTLTATGATSVFGQSFTGISGAAYTGSWWIRRRTGVSQITLRVGDNTAINISPTSTWQRLSGTDAATASTTIRCYVTIADSGDAVDVWHPQLEAGSTVTAYQNVTSKYLIEESGVASIPCLRMDSDWMNYSIQAFGAATAGFRATAADNWTVWLAYSTFNPSVTMISQTDQSLSTSRMFQIQLEATGKLQPIIAGSLNTSAGAYNDGFWHVVSARCTAGVVSMRVDRVAPAALTVGAASAEAADIRAWARTSAGTPSSINTGWGLPPDFIDRALSDTEWEQLQNQLCDYVGVAA